MSEPRLIMFNNIHYILQRGNLGIIQKEETKSNYTAKFCPFIDVIVTLFRCSHSPKGVKDDVKRLEGPPARS